jgi:hypothetical protein
VVSLVVKPQSTVHVTAKRRLRDKRADAHHQCK